MAVPLVIAGATLSVVGNLMSNQAQAAQEAQNAWFYHKQAEFARQATRRELNLEAVRYTQEKGMQTSALARGGASTSSGSAAAILATGAARSLDNLLAIKRKGELDATLAAARGDAAKAQADTYGSTGFNLLTSVTAGTSGAISAYNLSKVGS